MPISQPKQSESENEFMQRCMSDEKMIKEYPTEQRAAVCRSTFDEQLAAAKVSFDYDGTLTKASAIRKAMELVEKGITVYIISARDSKEGMLKIARRVGIPESRVYATGSNEAKVEKVRELGISTHYDNNADVIKELGNIGKLI
jgi:hydroxymethylpyrimidine pyrophosphatase-like HAD family hydrolase